MTPATLGLWASEHRARLALVDASTGETATYGELARLATTGPFDADRRGLILAVLDHDLGGVRILVSALGAGHTLLPFSSRVAVSSLVDAVRRYRPNWVVGSLAALSAIGATDLVELGHGYHGWRRAATHPLHPELQLLLPTSGSVGAPKTVKIAADGLSASLAQIQATLAPLPADRLLLTLPFVHVYGLTTLLSHLAAGATVILARTSVLDPHFRQLCDHALPTTLAGVSFTYDVMRKLGWSRIGSKSLRVFTHSGDRLAQETCEWAAALQRQHGLSFYKMYGMTETTGRVSVLPPDELAEHPGSVGRVVPQGRVRIEDGEVCFEGPNLAGGYARGADDLAEFARPATLATGDLGRLDNEGRLYLTGRKRLIAKIFGMRIGLEDVEEALAPLCPAAAVAGEERLILHLEAKASPALSAHLERLAIQLQIPRAAMEVRFDCTLPRTQTGKLLRSALDG